MRRVILLFIIATSLLQAKPTLTSEVKLLLKDAKSKVAGLTAEETKALIDKESVILIDVRDPNEWAKGGISSTKTINISRGFLEVKYPKLILKHYSKNDAFIVYCALELRSVLAASRLKDLGFTNVSYLKGGLKNWSLHRYPTTK